MTVLAPTQAALGDSITEGSTDAFKTYFTGIAYPKYAEMASGGRVRYPLNYNFGVSSERADEIRARVPSVKVVNPTFCAILAGTNNYMQDNGHTSPTLANEIMGIASDLASGTSITPVIITLPPASFMTSLDDSYRRANNEVLRRQSTWLVADAAMLVERLRNHPNTEVAGATFDTIHYNEIVHQLMGQALWGAYRASGLIGQVDHGSNFGVSVSGSGGTVNAPATGTISTGWTAGGAPLACASNYFAGYVNAGQQFMLDYTVPVGSIGAVGSVMLGEFDLMLAARYIEDLWAEITCLNGSTPLAGGTSYTLLRYTEEPIVPPTHEGKVWVQQTIVSGTTHVRIRLNIKNTTTSRGHVMGYLQGAAIRVV